MISTPSCGPVPTVTGKQGAFLGFALVALMLVPFMAPAKGRGVVIQVDTASVHTWRMALTNAANLLAATHPRIEIIALGRAVMLLKRDAPYGRRILALHRKGLQIDVCACDLRRFHLHRSGMSPAVRYIPSAIAEVVRRERQGWAYVQP